jgi:hypothetical protein
MGSFSSKHPRLTHTGFALLGGICALVISLGYWNAPDRSPASMKRVWPATPDTEARSFLPVLD